MKETILLLASEPVICGAIRAALENNGYFVLETHNLGAARDRLMDCEPRLLMVRHFIDTMSGHEAALYLRSLAPGIPVLIVGGLIDHPDVLDREIVHSIEVFPKPYPASELLAKVKEMLLRYPRRQS